MDISTFKLITEITFSIIGILLLFMFKTMVIDSIRYSGTLEKELIIPDSGTFNRYIQWYIQTPFKKITISKIYDEKNPYTLMLREKCIYTGIILDEDKNAIIPLWKLYQVNGQAMPDYIEDKYLNSESLWKIITK